MNMNQKTKYYLNLILFIFLLIIYIYDAKYVRRDIEIFETAISDIDMQLEAGSEVINDMNQVRQDFIKNKNTLAAYQISGNELMKEIQNLNLLADEMDIVLDDLEIDPRNTFPNIDQGQDGDQIVLERQSLSFNLSGNFLDIGDFLEQVIRDINMLSLNSCEFDLDKDNDRQVNASIEFCTYSMETI